MKIGIIGAGHIGGTLTRRLAALGHDVYVANSRGPDTLADLTKETGAKAVTVKEAARAGTDLVIVTIPLRNVARLPRDLFAGAAEDVVIVDTGNYYPQRDGLIEEIESGTTESRWTSKQLGRPVVKAFNTIYAQHLLEKGKPKGASGRIALPVAGDDETARKVVMDLVDELGFDPVDAGTIDESWKQQPGTPVYGTDLDAEGTRRALDAAKPDRPQQFRASGAPPTASRPASSGGKESRPGAP
ncbi:MAG TPA: NAD(P)-binding domain-containing protein [Gemmatimonadaceae bacterium]|nr:NAD(P)-binding domain-containing protein [Gemmatimonadaceae bacterium]